MLSFLKQLKEWLRQTPRRAISCHNNLIRSIRRRVFEHLNIEQMLRLEVPQDCLVIYELQQSNSVLKAQEEGRATKLDWKGIVIPGKVKFATDALNLLSVYYC